MRKDVFADGIGFIPYPVKTGSTCYSLNQLSDQGIDLLVAHDIDKVNVFDGRKIKPAQIPVAGGYREGYDITASRFPELFEEQRKVFAIVWMTATIWSPWVFLIRSALDSVKASRVLHEAYPVKVYAIKSSEIHETNQIFNELLSIFWRADNVMENWLR
jgi:hypothetical protein